MDLMHSLRAKKIARYLATVVLLAASAFSHAQTLPTIEDTVANAELMEGYFNLYWDASSGKMYWEIDELEVEFLYQVSMASGLGSNPVGIDRGQLRGTYVLSPKRIGPRILLMQPNYRYRASSDNELERQAVEERRGGEEEKERRGYGRSTLARGSTTARKGLPSP
ncbi:MAG: hypothetical protein CBE20_07695, partial [Gammaproteobacteria bacterium TMED260]